jgi:hypothetical protein
MSSEVSASARRLNDSSGLSAAMISDWARRVVALWQQTKSLRAAELAGLDDFGDACRVRDQLNNRLARIHPDVSDCAEQSLEILREADAFFLQFTVESSSADALSRHQHYAHRAEWWWRRQARVQAA